MTLLQQVIDCITMYTKLPKIKVLVLLFTFSCNELLLCLVLHVMDWSFLLFHIFVIFPILDSCYYLSHPFNNDMMAEWQDGKLPEDSVHDLAHGLVEALQ